jgi:predicted AAA+ superfamily ATPase
MIRREILKEVLLDNRNEVVKHQVIPRSFQFEEFGNYVFVGIRRAGKSFLLYQRIQELLHNGHTWNEMLYVNFEDERLIGMTAADLNLILEVHAEMSTDRPMLFLDEIQNIDGWDKFVRRLADNKYRAYVTGSNAKMLPLWGDDTLQYMYTLMILKSFFMLMGLKLQRILCLQQRAGQK